MTCSTKINLSKFFTKTEFQKVSMRHMDIFEHETYGEYRSSPSEVFLRTGVLKICSKFTAEHPCPSVISIKLLCNFIEIALRHRCSPVNLLHIFRTPFPWNTSGRLLLNILNIKCVAV